MTSNDYRLACDLFIHLRDLPDAEFHAALDLGSAGSPEVREEALRLIAAERAASSGFLERHAMGDVALSLGPEESAGAVVDRYRLIEPIGEGGMGEVWLAEQLAPLRRRVALKLVRAGFNSREVLARFESERQALALMDHPSIAKVFDAGSTSQGAPYFVMEYVPGIPLTTYCDQRRFPIRQRLELLLQICDGVQHSHQKAIIHRDLKPANILVAEVDGHPVPKIIDFGVAKALGPQLAGSGMFTQAGVLVGTLAYMSPEQARSAGEDIDTRTDVYALGVILYELLAGEKPLSPESVPLDEFLRKLREEDPPTPSAKLRSQARSVGTETALNRRSEPFALEKQIRGDLDWIALKALERERYRRYGSPSDLALDIRRYLNNKTVFAAPPSVTYRAGKFARRYRAALITITAFIVVLLSAAIISIRQTVRAQAEAANARVLNEFLQHDLLEQASAAGQAKPATRPDPDLKVRTALDRAAARIEERFKGQPEEEASIRDTVGQTYLNLGLYPEARKQLERARRLYEQVLGRDSLKALEMMNRLGTVSFRQGKYAQAESEHAKALEASRRIVGPQHPNTLSCMTGLALDYRAEGKYTLAEKLQKEALEAQRRALGAEYSDTVTSMGDLAAVYYQEGKYEDAEALYRQTLEIERRILGPEHPTTLRFMNNLALAYYQQGKSNQAQSLHRQTLEIERRVLGVEHQFTLNAMNNLANDYLIPGNYAAAEALYREAMTIQQRVLGPEHPETLMSMGNLASVEFMLGRRAEADALIDRVLNSKRKVLGPEHPSTLYTIAYRAFMLQREGKYSLAEDYARQALEGRRLVLGPENRDTVASMDDLALACISQGKFAQSEPLAREAFQLEEKKWPGDWQRFRAEALLGASLAGQRRYSEAEPVLLEGYRGLLAQKARMKLENVYYLDRSRAWIINLYKDSGQPAKALAFNSSNQG